MFQHIAARGHKQHVHNRLIFVVDPFAGDHIVNFHFLHRNGNKLLRL